MTENDDSIKQPAIIVDLDNTLALIGDRNPYDASDCGYDKLNHVVYRLMKKYEKEGYAIVLVSGRSHDSWEETAQWLNKHNINPAMIILRGITDKQPATSFKMRAYNEYIKGGYEVELALDDSEKICRMWRSLGLTAFQVDNGDF